MRRRKVTEIRGASPGASKLKACVNMMGFILY